MTTVVTLLTQPDCALCEHAKRVLRIAGADYALRVEEIPLDSPRGQELAVSAGVMFAPGILLDGQPFTYGRLSDKALRRALDQRVKTTQAPATHDRK